MFNSIMWSDTVRCSMSSIYNKKLGDCEAPELVIRTYQ